MIEITVITDMRAPIRRCFDLARSIDAHVATVEGTGERAIAGRTSGLIGLGESVTWEARHFGVRQRLTSRITVMDRPTFFQDRMERGAFRSFEHDHVFEDVGEGLTRMTDVLRFSAPGGPIGWAFERVVLGRYMRRFLTERAEALRVLAEGEGWGRYVGDASDGARAMT
ncbi:MAG: SRPBCC family protein [Planctomycetota bacterium]